MSSASSYCLLSTGVWGKDISKTELLALVRSSVPRTRAPTPAVLSPFASTGLQPVLSLEGKTSCRQLFGIRWSLRPLPTQTLLFCCIVPGCWLGASGGRVLPAFSHTTWQQAGPGFARGENCHPRSDFPPLRIWLVVCEFCQNKLAVNLSSSQVIPEQVCRSQVTSCIFPIWFMRDTHQVCIPMTVVTWAGLFNNLIKKMETDT